jgi:inner membrane protein
MDPLTQGLLGAGLAQSFAKKPRLRLAAICGALGGMAPDLDVLIRSASDPLLTVEYHRHFTHSLAFVPIGGLIVTMALWLLFLRKKHSFKSIYIPTTLGFATHALLDACTSYGTRLWWPFDNERVAWNIVSIVDPIFTGILLAFVIASIWRKSAKTMIIGMCLAMLYLGYGYYKHQQVAETVNELAQQRGHAVERMNLNPTIGNNILWRSVYQSGDNYYIDAVRVGALSEPQIKVGGTVPVLDINAEFPNLGSRSLQMSDIERFKYFSQGYIYIHPEKTNVIADLRYGTLPYDTMSLWGIEVDMQKQDEHVKWIVLRNFEQSHYDEFWDMLWNGF